MRVFLDTNVIMEYLCQRLNFHQAKQIMDAAYLHIYDACLSAGSLYTISYLLSRFLKEKHVYEPENTKTVRDTILSIMSFIKVVNLTHSTFRQSLNDILFRDLEDSYQYYCAVKNNCDVLVTFNLKHFVGSHNKPLKVMTPVDFIEKYLNKDE